MDPNALGTAGRDLTSMTIAVVIIAGLAILVAALLIRQRLRDDREEPTAVDPHSSTVTAVELSNDQQWVAVKARLERSAASIAQKSAVFWIVRPEVGIGDITGLSTVLTGPEIQVLPGSGGAASEFEGIESAPAALEVKGLKIVLRAPRLGSFRRNSPIYYRGVEVGVVQSADLGTNASTVDIHVLIRQRYAGLVRSGAVFWNVSGVSVSGGVFRGVEVKLESMRSLAAGGIAFATPEGKNAARAKDGAVFVLHDGPRKEWLAWAPQITIPPEK